MPSQVWGTQETASGVLGQNNKRSSKKEARKRNPLTIIDQPLGWISKQQMPP